MSRDELLAALLAERQDCRWFTSPPKEIDVPRDDDMTCARRRKAVVDTDEIECGRWVQNGRGVLVWKTDQKEAS